MKRFALTVLAFCLTSVLAYAGPESYSGKDKEVLLPAPPPCDWYRDHEWDLSIWYANAYLANTGTETFKHPGDFFDNTALDDVTGVFDVGRLSKDRFLDKRHVWGGGASIKYFWNRYLGLGVDGFVLDGRNTAGAALGTLTLRYPIGCSRFAPFLWAGGGGAFGGSYREEFLVQDEQADTAFFDDRTIHNDARGIAEFGGGWEFRVTRHIGWMNGFSWNIVDGPHNNFGLARSGLVFSF